MSAREGRAPQLAALFALAAGLASLGVAASQIIPAQPSAFETVNLRMTLGSCSFVPSSVRVSVVANTLQVTQQLRNCLIPEALGSPTCALGALPAGDYRVEVFATAQPLGAPLETLAFQVRELPETMIFPALPRPLTDCSGLWWNPQESGWGLSIHQRASPT